MARKVTTKATGDTFETTVSEYYEALGFSVSRNQRIAGHQIDILARKLITGGGTYTIAIEAKFRDGTVGINEVSQFITTAKHLFSTGEIQAAVLVANQQLSQDAKSAATPGIRLCSLRELQEDLFHFSEALLKLKLEYEASDIFHEYIPLRGALHDSGISITDVSDHVLNWANASPAEPLLLLVGDFGSGKTTAIERVVYELAKKRSTNSSSRFPVTLKLGKLLQYDGLWPFLTASLRSSLNIDAPQTILEAQIKNGALCFFLDGFDEIHTGANAVDRAAYLTVLAPLILSASPCVITTRPTYFESLPEMIKIFQNGLAKGPALSRVQIDSVSIERIFTRLKLPVKQKLDSRYLSHIIQIRQLDRQSIVSYLAKFSNELKTATGLTPEKVYERLGHIYDLTDLMSRPLLLKLVVSTIIDGGINILDPNTKVGPATIYEVNTQACAARDYEKWKGRQVLTTDERLALCRSVAMEMVRAGTVRLAPRELSDVLSRSTATYITKSSASEKAAAVERALTDLRVCTFLKGSDDGSLQFAHKSYSEFFVAQMIRIAWEFGESELGKFSEIGITREIVYFLGSYARDSIQFGAVVLKTLRFGMGPSRDVLLARRTAFASGVLLDLLTLTGGEISDVDLRRSRIAGLQLRQVQLSRVAVRSVSLSNSSISDFVADEVEFDDCDLSGADLSIIGGKAVFNKVMISQGSIALRGEWSVRNSTVSRCSLTLGGKGTFVEVAVEECWDVCFEKGFLMSNSGSIEFRGCSISSETGEAWYHGVVSVLIDSCTLRGVQIDISDLVAMTERSRRTGAGRIRFVNCRGFVVIEDNRAVIEEEERRLIEGRAGIRIVDLVRLKAELVLHGKREGASTAVSAEIIRAANLVREFGIEGRLASTLTEAAATQAVRPSLRGSLSHP